MEADEERYEHFSHNKVQKQQTPKIESPSVLKLGNTKLPPTHT
jgi:hypothetical protein